MLVPIFLSLVAIGFICWLLFTLAVYALPVFAAVSAGMLAYDSGAGPIGSIVVAVLAGVAALLIGQMLFATVRPPWIRALIAAVYVGPAALAGYHAVHGLSAIGGTAEPWRAALSIVGSIVVAIVAWSRMSEFGPAATEAIVGTSGSASEPPGRGIIAR